MILVDSLYNVVYPVQVGIPIKDLIWMCIAGMVMSVFSLIGAITVGVLLKRKSKKMEE
jgi:RsiW-degrading membrane proteinase PrsW (M82 family)